MWRHSRYHITMRLIRPRMEKSRSGRPHTGRFPTFWYWQVLNRFFLRLLSTILLVYYSLALICNTKSVNNIVPEALIIVLAGVWRWWNVHLHFTIRVFGHSAIFPFSCGMSHMSALPTACHTCPHCRSTKQKPHGTKQKAHGTKQKDHRTRHKTHWIKCEAHDTMWHMTIRYGIWARQYHYIHTKRTADTTAFSQVDVLSSTLSTRPFLTKRTTNECEGRCSCWRGTPTNPESFVTMRMSGMITQWRILHTPNGAYCCTPHGAYCRTPPQIDDTTIWGGLGRFLLNMSLGTPVSQFFFALSGESHKKTHHSHTHTRNIERV